RDSPMPRWRLFSFSHSRCRRMPVEQLDLSEFIKSALVSVANGVRGANAALKIEGVDTTDWFSIGGSAAKNPHIVFDVALTASRGQTDKAGLGVALAAIGAGAKTEKDHSAEAAHRLRFEVTKRYERV